ncbi:MAG: acyl-CoA dehydrogenase, partial [Deltaproteobacteria bacterium]
MNFEFSEAEKAFVAEVDRFIAENRSEDVTDVTRENMAQLADTPERREFTKKMAARGWFGMTWPKEYGGSEQEGVYEYLLNERLAYHGAPQIG